MLPVEESGLNAQGDRAPVPAVECMYDPRLSGLVIREGGKLRPTSGEELTSRFGAPYAGYVELHPREWVEPPGPVIPSNLHPVFARLIAEHFPGLGR